MGRILHPQSASTKTRQLVVAIACAWASPIASLAALAQAPARGDVQRPTVGVLIVESPDVEAFIAALRLRLPNVQLRKRDETRPIEAGGRAFASITQIGPTQFQIELVLADGRTFTRKVPPGESSTARVVAGTLANLIAGIEAGTTSHDSVIQELPEALVALDNLPDPDSELAPSPEAETRPPDSPSTNLPAGPQLPVEPPPPEPTEGGLKVALTLRSTPIIGFSPEASLRGGGGSVGLMLEWPKGALVAAGTRAVLGGDARLRTVRGRLAVGGGWLVSSGRFEVPVLGLAAIEPWWIRSEGAAVDLTSNGAKRVPLWAGLFVVEPRFRIESNREKRTLDVLIGLPLELSTAALAGTSDAAKIRLTSDGPESVVIGGLELSVGLAITLRRRRSLPN